MTTDVQLTANAWDNIAEGYDQFVTPSHIWLGNEAISRVDLRPGMRFLDVAAGSGALSIPAARRGARVVSVDLSPEMLSMLNKRAGIENLKLETMVMNGHELKFEDNTFDISGSQFGVMLFPDMPRALREMVRVTKSGGRVLMNVFGNIEKVEFFNFFVRAIKSAVPTFVEPTPDQPPLPFQLQDPNRLRQEMTNAGLKNVHVETVTEKLQYESGQELWTWLINSNPIAGTILNDLNLTKDQVSTIQSTLDILVRDRAGSSRYATITVPVHIGIGTK